MSANFFEQIAETQVSAPVKRKLDATEKRAVCAREAERELKEQDTLSKLYRQWKRAKRDALLAGPHGREVRGIVSFLETMTLSSAPALIGMVERARFYKRMTKPERADLLNIINVGIARCREKAGLEPFDDELPWCEPPKASAQIKTLLEVA